MRRDFSNFTPFEDFIFTDAFITLSGDNVVCPSCEIDSFLAASRYLVWDGCGVGKTI